MNLLKWSDLSPPIYLQEYLQKGKSYIAKLT